LISRDFGRAQARRMSGFLDCGSSRFHSRRPNHFGHEAILRRSDVLTRINLFRSFTFSSTAPDLPQRSVYSAGLRFRRE
jgi:hypothetical protein